MSEERWLPKIANITRREAAQGQLETAILLWFNEGDPVSTTFSPPSAARGILTVVIKEQGLRPSGLESVLQRQSQG